MLKLIILFAIILSVSAKDSTLGDLIKVATKHGKLEHILKAANDLGLADKFKTNEAITIFAPSDEVFDKLPKGTIEDLTKKEKSAIVSR